MGVRPLGLGLVLLICSVFPATVAGQSLPLGLGADQAQLIQQAQRQAMQRSLPTVQLALEGAVDPDQYIVGPGDEFVVSIGGSPTQEFRATVSAEGVLPIAEAGHFAVAGLTLAEAKAQIGQSLRRLYSNVPAEVALSQPRRFYVHVTGAVRAPGRHLVGPMARLEDAVLAAMNGENPMVVFRQEYAVAQLAGGPVTLPALRNIRVSHSDGSTSSVDLRRYYALGSHQQDNPYLRDGDVVHVPSFDPKRSGIVVEGNVSSPGPYDYRDGDTAAGILSMAAGRLDVDDLAPVRIVSHGQPPQTLRATSTSGPEELIGFHVRPGDRLFVPDAAPDLGVAYIEGRALFPGTYTIRTGRTTVRDLLELAGGMRNDALRRAVVLERATGASAQQYRDDDALRMVHAGASGTAQRPLTPVEIELSLEDEAFRALRLADLDFADRQYLLRELRGGSRTVVDLENGDGSDIIINDGDRLLIPLDPGGVHVFGQVANRALIPFEPGQPASYYIERAGGATTAATDAFVRRAGSGLVLPARSVGSVERGDEVFVNRRAIADSDRDQQLNLQEQQLRGQSRAQWIQIGAAVLSSATAIVTALIFSR